MPTVSILNLVLVLRFVLLRGIYLQHLTASPLASVALPARSEYICFPSPRVDHSTFPFWASEPRNHAGYFQVSLLQLRRMGSGERKLGFTCSIIWLSYRIQFRVFGLEERWKRGQCACGLGSGLGTSVSVVLLLPAFAIVVDCIFLKSV